MKQLRFWIIILGIWLTFFFNIERIALYELGANLIRSDTYIFVAGIGLAALILPRLSNLGFTALLAAATSLFLVLWYTDQGWEKDVSLSYSHLNSTILLTLIQINAIIITGLLARHITRSLSEVEETIANIIFNRIGRKAPAFVDEQQGMYQEIRRASRYHRPLVVMAMEIDPASLEQALPQVAKEVQQAMIEEFARARLAKILDDTMHDFDTIALRDNYFIAVLPETSTENAPFIAQRLGKVVKEKTGISLKIGTACFPDEALTFDGLVEQAIENAASRPATQPALQQQQPVAQEA